jgi:hypothetical protein
MYLPERRDYDVTKMGFKTGAGKTEKLTIAIQNVKILTN